MTPAPPSPPPEEADRVNFAALRWKERSGGDGTWRMDMARVLERQQQAPPADGTGVLDMDRIRAGDLAPVGPGSGSGSHFPLRSQRDPSAEPRKAAAPAEVRLSGAREGRTQVVDLSAKLKPPRRELPRSLLAGLTLAAALLFLLWIAVQALQRSPTERPPLRVAVQAGASVLQREALEQPGAIRRGEAYLVADNPTARILHLFPQQATAYFIVSGRAAGEHRHILEYADGGRRELIVTVTAPSRAEEERAALAEACRGWSRARCLEEIQGLLDGGERLQAEPAVPRNLHEAARKFERAGLMLEILGATPDPRIADLRTRQAQRVREAQAAIERRAAQGESDIDEAQRRGDLSRVAQQLRALRELFPDPRDERHHEFKAMSEVLGSD